MPTARAAGAVVNELYLLEGQKFSTSRNHALWAHEFLAAEDPELVRLYLSWDRPDRYESDFTEAGFRAFCEWAGPLLSAGPLAAAPVTPPDLPVATMPPALAAAELVRAERALHLTGFDAALAVRGLLAALSTGTGTDSVALAALTGRGTTAAGSRAGSTRCAPASSEADSPGACSPGGSPGRPGGTSSWSRPDLPRRRRRHRGLRRRGPGVRGGPGQRRLAAESLVELLASPTLRRWADFHEGPAV